MMVGFTWDNLGAPRGRRVRSGSGGFTRASLVIAGVIRVRVGYLGGAHGSPGLFVLTWVHSGARRGRRFHSGSRGFTQRS